MIKVAIIDDGVMPNYFCNAIVKFYSIEDNLNVISCNNSEELLESHATTCLKIIQKYCDSCEVEFYSIQILNQQTKQGNISKFIRALEFCLDLKIDLIHLSIGTRCYNDFKKIENCVQRLTSKGIVIVAAQSNQGTITYPAYLPNVIGVKCGPKLKGDKYLYCKKAFDGINFLASSVHVLRENNSMQITPLSNSFAAPLITAKVINFLMKNPNEKISEIYDYLISNSLNPEINSYNQINLSNRNKLNYLCLFEYDNVLECDIKITQVNSPVILVNGFKPDKLIEIVKGLSELFIQKGYFCKVAMDIPQAELLGFNVIPPDITVSHYIQRACSFFQCDILLLGQSQTFCVDECDSISVLVRNEFNRQEYNEYHCKETEIVFLKDEDVNWLFEHILEMLL